MYLRTSPFSDGLVRWRGMLSIWAHALRVRHFLCGLVAVVMTAVFSLVAVADEPAADRGGLVRIPVPITNNTESKSKQAILRAVEDLARDGNAGAADRPTLILEFTAAGNAGAGSRFGPAFDLARLITSRELASVKTVAFVPESISGHAVLPIMACEQVVMASDAEIGRAGRDEDATKPIGKTIVQAYTEIAERRRTFPVSIALGMLEEQHQVLRVETQDGPELVLQRDLEALLARTSEVPGSRREVVVERDEVGWFTGSRARTLGFVQYLAADRQAVAAALELPLQDVTTGRRPSQGIEARTIRVQGDIDARMSATRRRMIENSRNEGANYLCFWVDTAGGEVFASIELAHAIARLDPNEVRTVAYVPTEASGPGVLVALACDEIVVRTGAVLNGGESELEESEISQISSFLRKDLATTKQRRWSPPAAMFDPHLTLNAFRHVQSGRSGYFSPEELATLPNSKHWRFERVVSKPGERLSLTAEQAVNTGVAGGQVASFEEFKAREHLQGDVSIAEPGWTDELVDILTTPHIAALILVIGMFGMYAEVQLPGVGIGGFVATVAFILFFWANYMEQTANTLEILLFLVGIGCLVLEVFVIPGFGVFGLGGGALVIVSLVLASQTFVLPGSDGEFRQLRDSLMVVVCSGVACVGLSMIARRYLPHTPMFKHVLLDPPGAEHPEEQRLREAMVEWEHLVGQSGVAETQLTPAGKARIAGELIDVVSDGDLIEKGRSINVVEVHGNRVVVTAADG